MNGNTNELPQPQPQPIASPPPMPSAPQNRQPEEQSKFTLLIAAAVAAALLFGIGGYFVGRLSAPRADASDSAASVDTAPSDWEQLASGKKGFPIPGTGTGPLTYYSLDDNETVVMDEIEVGKSGSGAAGIGSSDPVASPDLFYIAFIGKDGNLWLFSNETGETQQLTSSGFVSHITGWSPDSKHILYYYDHETLASAGAVVDGQAPATVTFKPQVEQGFYLTNIENGKVTPLAAVKYTEGFIDNSTLLIKSSADSKRLATLNIDTLEADLALIQAEAGFGVGQFSFSLNNEWWAYLNPTNKEEPTKGEVQIVLGAYPADAATIVDAGSWGSVQRPMFSPDDKKIIYQKSAGLVNGISQYHVLAYDIVSGTKENVGEGVPIHWVDDKTVLVRKQRTTAESPTGYGLLDIERKRMTTIGEE